MIDMESSVSTDLANRILRPNRRGFYDVRAVLDSLSLPCGRCRGTGAQGERETCPSCEGLGRNSREVVPAEFWEALAVRDVIPASWVGNPARRFLCSRCMGSGNDPDNCPCLCRIIGGDCVWDGTRCCGERPDTVRCMTALASDVAGITQAELLVLEMAKAVHLSPRRVVWFVTSRDVFERDLADRATRWLRAIKRLTTNIFDMLGYFASHAVDALHGYDSPTCTEEQVYGSTLSANAAMRALLQTGYALYDLTADTITLACPTLEDEEL